MKRSALELHFDALWESDYPEMPWPQKECKLVKGRRFRWDRCWPLSRVAVSLQGGTWTRGRHTRGAGYERDCEKLNLAVSQGWRVFYLTTTMLQNDHKRWLDMIAEAVREGD